MKKLLSLILSLSILLSMATVTAVFAEDEVIFSDSFENGMDNWSYSSSRCNEENSTPTTEKASDGKTSVFISDADENTYGYTSVKIPAVAGATYKITADHYNVEGVGGKVFLTYVNEGGTRLLSKSTGTTETGEWKSVSLSVEAPEETAAIVVILTGSGAGTGKSYIDNIKIVKKDATDGGSAVVPAVDAKAGDVIFADDFENDLSNWSTSSSKTGEPYEISEEKAKEGKSSLKINDETTEYACGVKSIYIPIKEFNNYTLNVQACPTATTTVKAYLRVYDVDKKQMTQKSVNISAQDWTERTIEVTAAYNAGYVQVILTTDNAGTGTVFVDSVKVIDSGAIDADYDSGKLQDEFNMKLSSANAGDIVEIPDGTYNNVALKISSSGTEGKPVILKAQNPGKVIFKGESSISIAGSYVEVYDLKFESCTTPQIIRFEDSSKYCKLGRTVIFNCDPPDLTSSQKWVYIQGQYNTVSDCYFRGKASIGQMVEVIRKSANPDYHTIENCYFGDFKQGSANGLETLRIGTSPESLSGSYTTVSGCFFEQCDGEIETVSIKSCNNKILNNTLYNTNGAIVLRHGNENYLEGNLFIGGGKTSRPTGIRVIGEKHIVKNNYFYNLPVGSTALYIMDTNPNPLIHEYLPIKDIDVSNNTFVNVDTAIMLGERLPSSDNASNRIIPPQGKVSNNAIITYKGKNPTVPNNEPDRELALSNNLVSGKAMGYEGDIPEGLIYKDFEYSIVDGYLVPNGLGADIEKVKKAPTSPFDVMCDWIKKDLYDSGTVTFTPVKGDPFNTDLTVEKLLPKDGVVNVTINGYRKEFDVDPQLINSRTMVPMRAIFEEFGAEVLWDEATATATAKTVNTEIKITENSDISYVNSKEMKLDSPAVIIDGRFLVPLRFISESFGADVSWVDSTQTATIDYETNEAYVDLVAKHNIENALPVSSAFQSGDDGSNSIDFIFDGNFSSKWAVKPDEEGNPGYGIFDLSEVKELDKLYVSFLPSATRIYTYEFFASEDGVNYTQVVAKTTTDNYTGEFIIHELNGVKARYVKYVGYGNNENTWNNITELVITGQ